MTGYKVTTVSSWFYLIAYIRWFESVFFQKKQEFGYNLRVLNIWLFFPIVFGNEQVGRKLLDHKYFLQNSVSDITVLFFFSRNLGIQGFFFPLFF